jgi:hypothetical protein
MRFISHISTCGAKSNAQYLLSAQRVYYHDSQLTTMKLLLFLESSVAPVFFVVFVFALYLGRAISSRPRTLPAPGKRLRRMLHCYCDGFLPHFRLVPDELLVPGPIEGQDDTALVPPCEFEMYFSTYANLDMIELQFEDFFIEQMDCCVRSNTCIAAKSRDARHLLFERTGYEGRYNVVISQCPVRLHYRLRIGRVFEAH